MTSRTQVLESAIGQPIDQFNWKQRMQEGVLVELKIKRWRARKKIDLTWNLGIVPTPEAREAFDALLSLGSKLLLPLKTLQELDTIERSARLHLATYAYDMPMGKFVPYTTYRLWQWGLWDDEGSSIPGDEYIAKYGVWNDGNLWYGDVVSRPDHMVKPGNEYYKARFFDKRDEVKATYEEQIEKLLQEYQKIGKQTYQLLWQQAYSLLQMHELTDESAFLAYFAQQIRDNIKPADKFAESFKYDWTIERISLLNALETEKVTPAALDSELLQKEQERTAMEQRRILLDQMNRDLIAKAREQKAAMIDSFLTSMVTQMRSLTYEACSSVLASIKEQETLQGRPVIQLKNLVEQLRNLNFYGDQDIDSILTLLHSMLAKPAKERNIAEVTRQLQAIGTLTRGTILALGEQPREGRDIEASEIGISTTPDEEEIREARAEIREAIQHATLPDVEEREERKEEAVISLAYLDSEEQRIEREV